MKAFALAVIATAALAAPTFAQSNQPKPGTTAVPANIQHDRDVVKQDRATLKADQSAGKTAAIAKDQAQLKKDRAQLRTDMKAAGITPTHHKQAAQSSAASSGSASHGTTSK